MSKWLASIIILLIVLSLGVGLFFYLQFQSNKPGTEPVACTLDAKICPDGSAVGRVPPDCEFAPCPGIPSTPTRSTSVPPCPGDAKECSDGSYVVRIPPTCEFAPCPENTSPSSNIPAGWTTHTDEQYGYEISYPSTYQVVEDQYGWPNSIFMLYGGGQSYDLVIEAWDSVSEYTNKYGPTANNLVAHQVGSKYVTLLNMNFKPEVDQIIATFNPID